MIDISISDEEQLSYRDIQLKIERLTVYLNRTSSRLRQLKNLLNETTMPNNQDIKSYINRQTCNHRIEVKK